MEFELKIQFQIPFPEEFQLHIVIMDIFEKLSQFSAFVDDELHRIEAATKVVFRHVRTTDEPAEIAIDIQDEIRTLSKKVDDLIQVAQEQFDHFDGFIDGMLDAIGEIDEKITQVEDHAAKFGYVIRRKGEKEDIRSSLEEVQQVNYIVR